MKVVFVFKHRPKSKATGRVNVVLYFTASVEDYDDAPIERGYQREISAVSTASVASSQGSRVEETLPDFQPPKRYVKEEKKTPTAAATTFIMVGIGTKPRKLECCSVSKNFERILKMQVVRAQ